MVKTSYKGKVIDLGDFSKTYEPIPIIRGFILSELVDRGIDPETLLFRGVSGDAEVVRRIVSTGTDKSREQWKDHARRLAETAEYKMFGGLSLGRKVVEFCSPRNIHLAPLTDLDEVIDEYALHDSRKGVVTAYDKGQVVSTSASKFCRNDLLVGDNYRLPKNAAETVRAIFKFRI